MDADCKLTVHGNSTEDLLDQLVALSPNTRVPGRRGDDARELWMLKSAAKSLPLANSADCCALIQSEAPDFQIISKEWSVGIECTEAISEALARALAVADKYNIEMIDTGDFSRDDGNLSALGKQSFEDEIRLSNRLHSPAWIGDEPEELLASYAIKAIQRKACKLSDYRRRSVATELWLLIYDRTFAPAIDLRKTARLVKGLTSPFGFDKVFVLSASGEQLVEVNCQGLTNSVKSSATAMGH